jgi:hypothetical protein
MSTSDFYGVSANPNGRAFWGEMELPYELAVAVHRGESAPTAVIEVSWFMYRRKPHLVVGTSLLVPLIVHRSIRDVMAASGLTGWTDYPMRIVDRQGLSYEDFVGLGVHGRHGPYDFSEARPRAEYPTDTSWIGRRLLAENWDGSDLSVFKDPGHIGVLASPRAADLLKAHGGSELYIRPLSKIAFPPQRMRGA